MSRTTGSARRRLAVFSCAAICLFLALAVSGRRLRERFAFTQSTRSRLAFYDISGTPDQIPILEVNGQGLCAFDFDGDGWMDLYFVNGSTEQEWERGRGGRGVLLRNMGDGRFRDATRAAGVAGPPWGTGCAVADFDGDGNPDLLVLGWGESRLYRNLGGGRFEDVTAREGLHIPGYPSSAVFADLDGDGRLDLAVSRYVDFDFDTYPRNGPGRRICTYRGLAVGCPPLSFLPESTRLYRQLPDGRFADVSDAAGVSGVVTRGFGIVALPPTLTSPLPDLYVACDQMPNRLFINRSHPGSVSFEELGAELGAAYNLRGDAESGMGVAVGDLFEDGSADLFITNFVGHKNTLYRNLDSGFEDATAGTGLDAHSNELGWGVAIADFDADSHEDVVVANGHLYPQVQGLHDSGETYAQPIRLYAGEGRGHFLEIPDSGLGEPKSRRGLIAADLNNDGRLDLVTQVHRAKPEIFWNRSSPEHHWIRFRLQGDAPRDPMGARVTITLSDGSRRTAWYLPNQGYQSSQDPRIFFGLGALTRVNAVEILWPGGFRQSLGTLAADSDYRIRKGNPAERVPRQAFPVPRK